MRNFAIVALAIALVGELGVGYWLSLRNEVVSKREQEVQVRENEATTREANLTEQDRELDSRNKELQVRDEALLERGNKLDDLESSIEKQSETLEQEKDAFAQREKDEEEQDENQTYAFNILESHLDRIRDAFGTQQDNKSTWPPNEPANSDSPNPSNGSGSLAPISSSKSLERYEQRYSQIKESQPTTESGNAGREAALNELAISCAELIARGSVDSIRLQAELDVRIELMIEFARKLDLSEDLFPKNLFELLESKRLIEFEALQIRKVASLKELEAKTPGLYKLAVDNEAAVLETIREAKLKRPVDPTSAFAKAIFEKKLTREEVAELRTGMSDSAIASAIVTREGQLLAKSLAIDGSNVAVRLRLKQLDQSLTPDARMILRNTETQSTVLEYITSSSPIEPVSLLASLKKLNAKPESVTDAVKLFVESRFSDPIRAATMQVLLEETFTKSTGVAVSTESIAEFKRWMAGHLTAGQRHELEAFWLKPTLDIITTLKAFNDPRLPHPEEQKDVAETLEQFRKESSEPVGERDPREPRLKSSLAKSEVSSQELYYKLKIYSSLAPSTELKTSLAGFAIQGLNAQIDLIERALVGFQEKCTKHEMALNELKSAGEFSMAANEMDLGWDAIRQPLLRIKLRLDEILSEYPENSGVTEPLKRVSKQLAALPPTGSEQTVAPASDWADPAITKQIAAVGQFISAIQNSTSGMEKDLKLIRASKEVVELSYEFHGDHLPHEYESTGELSEQFKNLTKQERIDQISRVFREMYEEDKLIQLRDSLRAAKAGTLSKKGDSKFEPYLDSGAVFLGRDSLDREYFRIDGQVRVLHEVDGGVMNCPVYITH